MFFSDVFRRNGLCGGTYVEPFAGGASVALHLLFNQFVSRIIINDLDPAIYSFWHSVLNETETLCRLVRDTRITVRQWDNQRSIYSDDDSTLLERGFATLFLNRTNRSGILNGGIIGGRDQLGEWKIDARFNKEGIIKRIERIASHSKEIKLYNLDALILIRRLQKHLHSNDLIYFDPPYFAKGQKLYMNAYAEEDHASVAGAIASLRDVKWIVTYDDVSLIRSLYAGHRSKRFALDYTANSRSIGREVMFWSKGLRLPSKISAT
jgi:DNA adenine methylase